MRLALLTAVVVGLAASLLCGCGGDAGTPTVVMVREQNFEGSVTLRERDSVEVFLNENPSTGNAWTVTWAPEGSLTKLSDTFIPSGTNLPGAGGKHSWLLKPTTAGTVTLTLQYGQPWAGGMQQPAHSVQVNVTP